jgi:hypothetical protein
LKRYVFEVQNLFSKAYKHTDSLRALASKMLVKRMYSEGGKHSEGRLLKTPVNSSYFEGPMAKQKIQALEVIVRQF